MPYHMPSLTNLVYKILTLCLFFNAGCKKKETASVQNNLTGQYRISGNKILNYGNAVQLMGANGFHVFGAGGSDMNKWNLDMVREFVGNMKEARLSGGVIQDANGAFLHSLQTVADSNRQNKRVTIFCAFGWDGTGATEFTGKRPTLCAWWNDFKIKLQQWAIQFKDQPDVWIEVWNEPYRFDRADGYTDDIWTSDMTEMVNIIRNAGNQNIILVPCAEQGQDERVLLNKGAAFLSARNNILFDIHAYEKWLLVPAGDMGNRLAQLKQQNLPFIFGEMAPLNASVLMDPKSFLDSIYFRGISACAWVWKYDTNDRDALLDNSGLPNNNQNNNWGTLFKNYCIRPRNP